MVVNANFGEARSAASGLPSISSRQCQGEAVSIFLFTGFLSVHFKDIGSFTSREVSRLFVKWHAVIFIPRDENKYEGSDIRIKETQQFVCHL